MGEASGGASGEARQMSILINYYTERINKDTEQNAVHYLFRSTCYERLQQYDEALDDAKKIIDIDRNYWKGHHQALNLYIKMKRIDEADEIAKKMNNDKSFEDLITQLKELKLKQKKESRYEQKKFIKTTDVSSPYTAVYPTKDISSNHQKTTKLSNANGINSKVGSNEKARSNIDLKQSTAINQINHQKSAQNSSSSTGSRRKDEGSYNPTELRDNKKRSNSAKRNFEEDTVNSSADKKGLLSKMVSLFKKPFS